MTLALQDIICILMASLYEIINVEEECWSFQVPKTLCLGIRRYLETNVADSSLFLCQRGSLMRKCLLALVQSYDLEEKSINKLSGNFYFYLDPLLATNISLLESPAVSKDSPLLYYFYYYYLAHKYLLLRY